MDESARHQQCAVKKGSVSSVELSLCVLTVAFARFASTSSHVLQTTYNELWSIQVCKTDRSSRRRRFPVETVCAVVVSARVREVVVIHGSPFALTSASSVGLLERPSCVIGAPCDGEEGDEDQDR